MARLVSTALYRLNAAVATVSPHDQSRRNPGCLASTGLLGGGLEERRPDVDVEPGLTQMNDVMLDGEDVVEQAYDFIDKKLTVDNARKFAFVNVNRMPRMNGNPIIVKFVSMIERDVVLRHAYTAYNHDLALGNLAPLALASRLRRSRSTQAVGRTPPFEILATGMNITIKSKGKPWMTYSLKRLMRLRDKNCQADQS
ncbi:hypothetical protein Bbelb_393410 [Branchiostoma belcheri]|nr:hypothetical protein Bbelb_393410 [Branchiostoma belcheri]